MSLAEQITRRMGGNWHGTYGTYPGEGHSRKDRSVSIKDAPDKPEGVVLHCHAGDDWRSEMDRLRQAGFVKEFEPQRRAKMKFGPRSSENDNSIAPLAVMPREESAYGVHIVHIYRDETGEEVCRKVRSECAQTGEKDFRWLHNDGRSNGRGSHPVIPYRLDELVKDAESVIVMAEGEKCADFLAAQGFLSTSSHGLPSTLSPWFEGRTVVILPDNDETGAQTAAKALEKAEKAGARAFIVELDDLPPKGDICDWNGTADDLAKLIEDVASPDSDIIELDDVVDWEGVELPPRRWLLEGWLPVGEAALLTGAGSVGKSLVSQQLAATIAAGQPFMGLPVEQVTSLYITCEDSREEAQRRHQAIAEAIGTPISRGMCLVKSWKGELDLELATFDGERRLRPTKRFQALRNTVLATGARLVILDNTSHFMGGDENVKREVAAFVNLLNGLAEEIDGVVLILGHPNKTGLNSPSAGDANQFGGSVAWENQVRSRMFMSAPDPDDPDARDLSNPKANYAGKGDNRLNFRWHRGAFIRPDDLPADYAAELAQSIRVSGENAAFLRCLEKATEQKRAVSHNPGSNYAPKVFAAMTIGKGHSEKAFKAAMERLLHLGKIALDQPLWRGPNRVMKQGIKEAEDCTDPPAPTPCTDPHDTTCTDPHASTPLYPTDNSGAANGAAAPFSEQGEDQ